MRLRLDITHILGKAQQVLRDFKGRQLAGADNIVVTSNESVAAYDKTLTVANGAAGTVTVAFDADNQNYSFTDPTFTVYEGSVAPANLLFVLSNDGAPTNVDGTTGGVREVVSSSLTPRRTEWAITIFNASGSSQTYYIKAKVRSADTGTIS